MVTTLSLSYFVQDMKRCKNKGLVGFHNLTIHDHLVQDIMCFFYVIHDIKFTNILKILIHGLNKIMYKLQIRHLIFFLKINPNNKVK